MTDGSNETTVYGDPRRLTTSPFVALAGTGASAAKAGGGGGGSNSASDGGKAKPKKLAKAAAKAPKSSKPIVAPAAKPKNATKIVAKEAEKQEAPPAATRVATPVTMAELTALAARARKEQQTVERITMQLDVIDAELEQFRADNDDVLTGPQTPLRLQLEAGFEQFRARKHELFHGLHDLAPVVGAIIAIREGVRMRGEAGFRSAVGCAEHDGFVRALTDKEVAAERSRGRGHLIIEVKREGVVRRYFPVNPTDSGHRTIVGVLRKAKYDAMLMREREEQRALALLTNNPLRGAMGLKKDDVLDLPQFESLFNPTTVVVAPNAPATDTQRSENTSVGTYGFALHVHGLKVPHPRGHEMVAWNGTLRLAVRPVTLGPSQTWKALMVWEAVGPIRTILPAGRQYFLPAPTGRTEPISRSGKYKPASRAVRALVEYILANAKESASCLALSGLGPNGAIDRIKTQIEHRAQIKAHVRTKRQQRTRKAAQAKDE